MFKERHKNGLRELKENGAAHKYKVGSRWAKSSI